MIEPHWQAHEGQGPHLLLVHGFLTSATQWRPNLEALASVCRPVTVELFGHNHSPAPADPACYTPEYYLECFDRIRLHLGASCWLLLGYSLGAGLTLRYAIERPEQTIAHLFTNSTSALAPPAHRRELVARGQEMADRIRTGGTAAMARIPVHPRHARRLPSDLYDALLEDAGHHDPAGIANTIAITSTQASMHDRLAENTRPACLTWGTRERRFRPLAEHALAVMPHLEAVRLDAGHGMNMEAPEAFNDAVTGFIRQWT